MFPSAEEVSRFLMHSAQVTAAAAAAASATVAATAGAAAAAVLASATAAVAAADVSLWKSLGYLITSQTDQSVR